MKKKNSKASGKLSLNKTTISYLQKEQSKAIRGAAGRSIPDGDGGFEPSCVNKATICDCAPTDGCPTFTCNYTDIYIGTRCF